VTDAILRCLPGRICAQTDWQIWSDVVGQKAVFLLFDLLTIPMVWFLMKLHGADPRNILLYAWNPLVIFEIAGSGHHDSLGICLLVAGILAWETKRLALAGLALAASFLTKYLSALLIPKMILAGSGAMLGVWASAALAGLVLVRPPIILAKGPAHYAANWQFNGSIYPVLQTLANGNGYVAKVLAALTGFAAMWVIARRPLSVAATAASSIGAALLLAPTVHPWYLLWLIPFLCLCPHPALLIWNGTIVLSYTVLRRYRVSQAWDLSPIIQIGEYAPVYLALAAQWIREIR
jgi:hypothetical protein